MCLFFFTSSCSFSSWFLLPRYMHAWYFNLYFHIQYKSGCNIEYLVQLSRETMDAHAPHPEEKSKNMQKKQKVDDVNGTFSRKNIVEINGKSCLHEVAWPPGALHGVGLKFVFAFPGGASPPPMFRFGM